MSAYHTPVMQREALDALNLSPGRRVVDATMGGAGHSAEIAQRVAPGGTLIALDQDTDAVAEGKKVLENAPDTVSVRVRQANFAEIKAALVAEGIEAVDGVLFDLGVSSHQLDTAGRGFAIRY